jgi:N,N'-diacetyllegionaminate synthase
MTVYVIAEAGINHNGSMAAACQLIDAAKRCGADAVKFQTYVTDDICHKSNPEYADLKRCELSYDDFRYLFKYAAAKGIDFISTPDTVEDAEFLDTLGMRYMKIGSANANNAFLESISHTKTPKIVSLGMCDRAFTYCHNVACWMHCVSSYPCPPDQANMACVGAGFYGDTIGFSDHTMGEWCAIMAVARGARFIEKHFTLDRYADGPDHHMSAQPAEFRSYVGAIRQTERALGDGIRRVMPCEQKTIEQLKARKQARDRLVCPLCHGSGAGCPACEYGL